MKLQETRPGEGAREGQERDQEARRKGRGRGQASKRELYRLGGLALPVQESLETYQPTLSDERLIPGSSRRTERTRLRRSSAQATLQLAPFTLKAVGFAFALVQVPLKPGEGVTLAPAATLPL